MNDTKTLEELKREYEELDMQLQACLEKRQMADKQVQANIDKKDAEAQWRCQRAAEIAYSLQQEKMKLDKLRYQKLLEICERMRGKEEKRGLRKFVSSAKQKISFIGSKVFKAELNFTNVSDRLNAAEKAIQGGDDINFSKLTFARIRRYAKWNDEYSNALAQEYNEISVNAYRSMITETIKEQGVEVSSMEELEEIVDDLGPKLNAEFYSKLQNEYETKKAEKAKTQPLRTPIPAAKPMRKEDLSAEQQQRFDEIHARKELPAAKFALESAEGKQARIQGDISRIKTEINDVYENATSAFGFTEEENQKLDEKRNQAALLQSQLDDMAAEEKRMFEERRQARIEADKAARAERIADINKKNAVEEARSVLSHLKTSTGYYNVANLSDEEVLDTYRQIKESPSMADRLSEARIEARDAKQTANVQPEVSQVTPESVFGGPVELEPDAMVNVAEKGSEPIPEMPEPTFEPTPEMEEQLRNDRNDESIEEIATNLTPEMYGHYRSIMSSFEPDTEEYKNASAIVSSYDAIQMEADKQAAIDSLHQSR